MVSNTTKLVLFLELENNCYSKLLKSGQKVPTFPYSTTSFPFTRRKAEITSYP